MILDIVAWLISFTITFYIYLFVTLLVSISSVVMVETNIKHLMGLKSHFPFHRVIKKTFKETNCLIFKRSAINDGK